jgi:hypothetical protein
MIAREECNLRKTGESAFDIFGVGGTAKKERN